MSPLHATRQFRHTLRASAKFHSDFDIPKKIVGYLPELYTSGITRSFFTMHGFWGWTLDAFFVAAVATWVPLLGMQGALNRGNSAGAYEILGWVSMHIITWGVNLRLVLEINAWTVFEHVTMWGTLVVFMLIMVLFSFVLQFMLPTTFNWYQYFGFILSTYSNSQFWLSFVLGTWMFLMPRLVVKSYILLFRELTPSKRARRKISADGKPDTSTRGQPPQMLIDKKASSTVSPADNVLHSPSSDKVLITCTVSARGR